MLMPSRNAIKDYVSDSFYHIYNRGVEKRKIFLDERDYAVFLSYFKVALSERIDEDIENEALSVVEEARLRRLNLHKDIELVAYCLVPNHFHLLIYQKGNPQAITELMRSTMSGYVRYFNKRYNRVGSLFQGRYKASLIDEEAYLWHISRYIHLNSLDKKTEPEQDEHSSYQYYIGKKSAEWLHPERILEMHGSIKEYTDFVEDYKDQKEILDEIKHQLANY